MSYFRRFGYPVVTLTGESAVRHRSLNGVIGDAGNRYADRVTDTCIQNVHQGRRYGRTRLYHGVGRREFVTGHGAVAARNFEIALKIEYAGASTDEFI